MVNIIEIKKSFDNHEIDASSLSAEQIILLCDMYEQQIKEIDEQISDISYRIEIKKNKMRKQLNEIREVNNKKLDKLNESENQ